MQTLVMEKPTVLQLPVMHALEDQQQREPCYIKYKRKRNEAGKVYYDKEVVMHDDCIIQKQRRDLSYAMYR